MPLHEKAVEVTGQMTMERSSSEDFLVEIGVDIERRVKDHRRQLEFYEEHAQLEKEIIQRLEKQHRSLLEIVNGE